MATKRYYWIKLKKDFFSGMHQRKMRKQPHGELLLIIYLKMMLATCDTEGKFYYQGVFEDIATEIAETIAEEPEDVRNALEYLANNGLVDLSPDECYTPEVMACVGSECDSAERVRNFRKKEVMLQCNDNVTESNARVTACNTEKEIDKDIDKDIDIVKSTLSPTSTLSNNIHTLSTVSNNIPTVEQVQSECNIHSFEVEPAEFVEHCKSHGIKDWHLELTKYAVKAAGRNRNRRKEMKD